MRARSAGGLVLLSTLALAAGTSGRPPRAAAPAAPRSAAGGPLFLDSGQSLGNANDTGVALGDLDGDGDLDAFVVTFDSAPHRVWINQGGSQAGTPGVFADSGQVLGTFSGTDVALGDFDGDGDLDAWTAHDGPVADRVWSNDGDANFVDSGQALGAVSSQAVAVGDLDGDGDLDALVAASGGGRAWLNQGGAQGGTPGVFLEFGPLLGPFNALAVALGDLNGDGSLDAFFGCGGTTTGAPDRVFFGLGTGAFFDSKQLLGTTRTYDVTLFDADGDGDRDAWAATGGQPSQDRGDRLYVNQGGAQGGPPGTFLGTGSTFGADDTRGVAPGDFDVDGDLDLFAANQSGADRVWLNIGGGVFTDAGEALGFDLSMDVALGDVDSDGSLDAFVAAFGPDRVWLGTVAATETPGLFRAALPLAGSSGSPAQLALADLDVDGDPDVLYGRVLDEIRTLINQGGVQGGTAGEFAPGATIPDLPGFFDGSFAVEDLDGDGDPDLFLAVDEIFSGEAGHRVYVNQGGAQGGPAGTFADSGQRLGSGYGVEPLLVDVDRDGDLDAVVRCGGFSTSGARPTQLWVNQGGLQGGTAGTFAFSPQDLGTSGSSLLTGDSNRLAADDLDGDGDADLVLVVDGELGIYLNQGGAQGGTEGTFADSAQRLRDGESPLVGAALADFDEDGDLDLATASYHGSYLIHLNDGTGGLVASPWCQSSSSGGAESLVAADFDGDGHVDLAAGARANATDPRTAEGTATPALQVFFGDGTGRITFGGQCLDEPPVQGGPWNPEYLAAVTAGDVDLDGDLDLLAIRSVAIPPSGTRPVLFGNGGPPGFERCCTAQYALFESRRHWDPVAELCLSGPPGAGGRAPSGGDADGLVDLSVYSALRSPWLPERSDSQWLVDFYSTHQLEVTLLVAGDLALLDESITALRTWEDDVGLLVAGDGEQETVSQDEIDAIEAFLLSLVAEGSPMLAQAITNRLAQLPPLDTLVGMTIEEAAIEIVGVHVPFFADGFESGDTSGWSATVP